MTIAHLVLKVKGQTALGVTYSEDSSSISLLRYGCCIVGIFRSNSLFIGPNVRGSVNEGRADFTPIFLSEVPLLFRRKILNLDVALIQVSPPDSHGFCTLGPSVDTTRAAIQNAKFIIGRSLFPTSIQHFYPP